MENLTVNELKILNELKANQESERDGWGMVYIDNCPSANTKAFAGTLASLTVKGYYRPIDDGEKYSIFGEVKIKGGEGK